jgi:Holliday junction DNA helicase RuvA
VISRLKGALRQISDQNALVENAGLYYEVMLPSALAQRLKDRNCLGEEVVFETIYYIEAGDKKAAHHPRLVGFTERMDREFFSLLTQVPGLGVKKALKSLVIPIRDIATAIETKDSASLSRLPGVGPRLAEKIIAELNGKTTRFALSRSEQPLAVKKAPPAAFTLEALEVLQQLQYGKQEAQELVDRTVKSHPKVRTAEELITLIFKAQRQGEVVD